MPQHNPLSWGVVLIVDGLQDGMAKFIMSTIMSNSGAAGITMLSFSAVSDTHILQEAKSPRSQ
jgi:hypothetical protein